MRNTKPRLTNKPTLQTGVSWNPFLTSQGIFLASLRNAIASRWRLTARQGVPHDMRPL
jgi:hypothetical protein